MNTLKNTAKVRSAWTGGFWKNRWDACRDHMIPHMWEILDDKELSHCWENFLIADGQAEGEHVDPPFWDGDLFKWLQAAIRVYGDSDQQEWLDRIDAIIDTITRIQRDDGYLFTYSAIQHRNNADYEDLQEANNFEMYNLGHLISAAVVHHQVTGKTNFLDVGIKAAAFLASLFDETRGAVPRTAVCPSHYMGLAELYQVTGDEQYIELLEKLIALRDRVEDGTDDNQDRIPLGEHREILGHGVRATYLYAGVTDLYRATGDSKYAEVVQAVWNDLVSKKIYITGGCAPLYDGVSPYGSWEHDKIQRTHQSFGRAYELPNTAGYNETCASIGNYLWNYRMASAFGDGVYGDYMERAIYNSILSGIDLAGEKYFYTNALRCVHDLPYDLKWGRHREAYLTCFCCPPNVVRTLAETQDRLAITHGDGIAYLMYGDARTTFEREDGTGATLRMRSDYPWDGEISIVVEERAGTAAFPVTLRIPAWADGWCLSVNGQAVDATADNGFVELQRDWQAGDRIELSLPMAVTLNESHPMVEETRNHVAVTRGPIVYCLETADLPAGTAISDAYIDPDTPFTFAKTDIGGTGLGVLRGQLHVSRAPAWTADTLYRSRALPEFESIPATLVPYFAWDNRDQGEMTVWLPLQPTDSQGAS
ncbi:glycoside hydrolase family 127 protein [Marinihelvus fidelis]|uniref:Glycoside hydrolase family 127 protein n=1 Tax=Marinihelvus fidelis TaxID=2613842 RepID=A0A5N0T9F2_9GAMM|nr:beta-L-arabinofuranosidase domain-containing protein [Marinihelvus fidelis]KAA9131560.1 glycoside hydrolase family 127 protein [Marinihelvus fidelis]